MSNAWDYDDLNEFQQTMYTEFGLSPDRTENVSGGYFMRDAGNGFDPKKYFVWVEDNGDGTYVVVVHKATDGFRLSGHRSMRSGPIDRSALFDILEEVCERADFSSVH